MFPALSLTGMSMLLLLLPTLGADPADVTPSGARAADTCAAPARPARAQAAASGSNAVQASSPGPATAQAPAPRPDRPVDTCLGGGPVHAGGTVRSEGGPARPRPADAADPFLAAMLGALPLASGFYVSDTPVKGVAFTLADVMLIGAIIQIRSDANKPPKDAATYYWLLAGVNLADAVLSALQVQSDAAKRLSVNVIPSDRPGFLLGWRF